MHNKEQAIEILKKINDKFSELKSKYDELLYEPNRNSYVEAFNNFDTNQYKNWLFFF